LDGAGRQSVSHVYVCTEDEGLALSAALLLLNHLRRFHVPIVVRMNRQVGLAALLRAVGAAGNRAFEQLRVFNLLEQACQPDLVLGGTNEVLARALHQDYRVGSAGQPDNPAAVPWDNLPLDMKESNRKQADYIATRLEAVGCHIVPMTALDADAFTFTPDEVERLAVMEHDRWVVERKALGWTRGPRDAQKKTNPNLVAWDELDENTKQMNRSSVTQLPVFLNRTGYTVRRYSA
jgi:RyR domain-containing protein